MKLLIFHLRKKLKCSDKLYNEVNTKMNLKLTTFTLSCELNRFSFYEKFNTPVHHCDIKLIKRDCYTRYLNIGNEIITCTWSSDHHHHHIHHHHHLTPYVISLFSIQFDCQ
jgi:hypothetical protein